MHMPSFICALSAIIVLILTLIFLSLVAFVDLHSQSTPNDQIEEELEENYSDMDTNIATI